MQRESRDAISQDADREDHAGLSAALRDGDIVTREPMGRLENVEEGVIRAANGSEYQVIIRKGAKEYAAYLTDRSLSLDVVPETALRDTDGEMESVQVRLSLPEESVKKLLGGASKEEFAKVRLLAWLTQNISELAAPHLRRDGDKLFVFDFDHAFSGDDSAEEPDEGVHVTFAIDREAIESLGGQLPQLIGKDAADVVLRRIGRIAGKSLPGRAA